MTGMVEITAYASLCCLCAAWVFYGSKVAGRPCVQTLRQGTQHAGGCCGSCNTLVLPCCNLMQGHMVY